jgi:succinate dehydrogenase / fumarate reductase, membrane anchor subunit
MVRREVVGAHYGLRDWLAQRVTAVVMTVYTLALVVMLAGLPEWDYENWRALFAAPVMRYGTALFILSLLLHTWVGVRNIFMDYVKPAGLRLTLHALVIIVLVWYAIWSAQILWSA